MINCLWRHSHRTVFAFKKHEREVVKLCFKKVIYRHFLVVTCVLLVFRMREAAKDANATVKHQHLANLHRKQSKSTAVECQTTSSNGSQHSIFFFTPQKMFLCHNPGLKGVLKRLPKQFKVYIYCSQSYLLCCDGERILHRLLFEFLIPDKTTSHSQWRSKINTYCPWPKWSARWSGVKPILASFV